MQGLKNPALKNPALKNPALKNPALKNPALKGRAIRIGHPFGAVEPPLSIVLSAVCCRPERRLLRPIRVACPFRGRFLTGWVLRTLRSISP
jgi:hypothetical protein